LDLRQRTEWLIKRTRDTISRVFGVVDVSYLRKWLVVSVLIGIVAGLGAILLYSAIKWVTWALLGIAGYVPPVAGGEGLTIITAAARPWLIPLVTTLGGLISGLLVFGLAPEAEGHGTDSAIDAFHNKQGFIRRRVPLVKLVASAITIGSGGSAGREGPVAQIGAGFGSFIADVFHLNVEDRRIAVASGIGAGIGSIFKAPLGGAMLSVEVLYRRDFEFDALLPSFMASLVGYSVFATWHGWTPIFTIASAPVFNRPQELLGYVILGVACGLFGTLYGRSFYWIRDTFRSFKVPNYVKPAIGGLGVGIIGIFLPQILGAGYGWVQLAINGDFVALSLPIMVGVVFGKILATGLTVGSGGSGGVFAPGLVIGGMLGGSLWIALHRLTAIMPDNPTSFVIVGMMALFGGIAKAPLAVMIMVSEMSGSYALLAPCMVAVVIAYFLTGSAHIYEKQVETRADSPAHRAELSTPLLKRFKVIERMKTRIISTSPDSSLAEAVNLMRAKKVDAVPVLDRNKLVGIVATLDLAQIPEDRWDKMQVRDIMIKKLVFGYPSETLYEALAKMTKNNISHLPVVDFHNRHKLIGIITINDIALAYTVERQDVTS
jgi:CIC family chloride channel protein